MASKKKTAKKPKPQRRARAKAARAPVRPSAYALCLNRPFAPFAYGAKVPDMNASPSSTFAVRAVNAWFSTAAGDFACAMRPRLFQHLLYNPSIAAGVINWGAGTTSNVTNYTTIAALYNSYRVVGGGVRITYTGNWTNTSGYLHWARVPNTGTGTVYPTTAGEFIAMGDNGMVPVNSLVGKSLILPFRLVDVDAVDYRQPSQADSDGWSEVVFYATGMAASAAVFTTETIMHVEGLPVATNTGVAVSPAAPYNPGEIAQATNGGGAGAYFARGVESAASAAGSFIRSAGAALYDSLSADQLGGIAGNALASYAAHRGGARRGGLRALGNG